MAYQCPRCGKAVRRGTSTGAGVAGGAVGAMLYAAFGPFQCPDCGTIPRKEFPPEVRRQMNLGSFALVASAVILLIVAIVVIVLLTRR